MADPTPWQLANAGQKVPEKPVYRPIFSHGTVPWPYAPGFVVITNGTEVAADNGPYGVNTHQS